MEEYQVGQIYERLKESDLYILTEFFKMLGNPARIRGTFQALYFSIRSFYNRKKEGVFIIQISFQNICIYCQKNTTTRKMN